MGKAPVPGARALAILAGGQEFKSGDWDRGECGASPVFASRNDCFRCGAPKPAGAGFNADRARPRGGGSSEFRQNFEGTRCFVENLSFEVDWRMLKDAFAEEGYPIVYASVSTERDSGRSKGHGIVQFETVHAAEHAIAEMTGYELDGRRINVRPDFQERNRRGGAAVPRARGAAPAGCHVSTTMTTWTRTLATSMTTSAACVATRGPASGRIGRPRLRRAALRAGNLRSGRAWQEVGTRRGRSM